MNDKLETFARNELKEGLSKLPEKSQRLFKQMYANGNLEMDINDCVDSMPSDKLDWAMQQVERTINK